MTTARLTASLWIAFAGAFLLTAGEGPAPAGQPLKLELTGSVVDGPNLAYAMMRTFMTEQEWQQRVADCRRRFQTWEHDNHGDMGQFLNDRLIIVALSAAGGEIEEIQKGVAYLALYKEFRQVPPGLVLRFLKEHSESVTELLSSFTWEEASEYVKNKRWREDIAKRKAKARQERAEAKANEGTTEQTDAAESAQPVREVAAAQPATRTAEARPPSRPAETTQALPQSTLELMSLNWDVLSAPFMAETPLRAK